MKVAPIVRLKLCLYDVWGVKKQSPTIISPHHNIHFTASNLKGAEAYQ
jgi:hypothetical protein